MKQNVISFIAKSGTGKTTLLEQVISELKNRGYRLGVVKHDAHNFDIDKPGKDSYRFSAAGADTMLITSSEKLAMVKKHDQSPEIEELVETYFDDVDLVLTEGFKHSSLPKIEVHRKGVRKELISRGERHDPALVAVATDEKLNVDVSQLDLNNPGEVVDFIETMFNLQAP